MLHREWEGREHSTTQSQVSARLIKQIFILQWRMVDFIAVLSLLETFKNIFSWLLVHCTLTVVHGRRVFLKIAWSWLASLAGWQGL